jgi:hypothetical protein
MSVLCASVVSSGLVTSANAAFESRLGGQAFYDTDLDITWLTNANAGAGSIFDDGSNTGDGRMSWTNANDWAVSLDINGITGWRLADMDVNGDDIVVDCATATATDCLDNEYGYHFYNNGIHSSNTGPFSNVQTTNYWSRNESSSNAWLFDFTFNDGSQLATSKNYNASAWAVYDGDVAAVPVPGAVWLFSSGLLGLIGISRRKRAA